MEGIFFRATHQRSRPWTRNNIPNSSRWRWSWCPTAHSRRGKNGHWKAKEKQSPGSDGIPAELIKHAGDDFVEHLHQLFNKIWTSLSMQREWNMSMITPIFKKGDPKECKNHRGISVLNSTYKILSSILCQRLKSFLNDIIGDYQCGFRPGKSTTDQIFTLRQILEKTREYQ